jgi:hypothetical protein
MESEKGNARTRRENGSESNRAFREFRDARFGGNIIRLGNLSKAFTAPTGGKARP